MPVRDECAAPLAWAAALGSQPLVVFVRGAPAPFLEERGINPGFHVLLAGVARGRGSYRLARAAMTNHTGGGAQTVARRVGSLFGKDADGEHRRCLAHGSRVVGCCRRRLSLMPTVQVAGRSETRDMGRCGQCRPLWPGPTVWACVGVGSTKAK